MARREIRTPEVILEELCGLSSSRHNDDFYAWVENMQRYCQKITDDEEYAELLKSFLEEEIGESFSNIVPAINDFALLLAHLQTHESHPSALSDQEREVLARFVEYGITPEIRKAVAKIKNHEETIGKYDPENLKKLDKKYGGSGFANLPRDLTWMNSQDDQYLSFLRQSGGLLIELCEHPQINKPLSKLTKKEIQGDSLELEVG